MYATIKIIHNYCIKMAFLLYSDKHTCLFQQVAMCTRQLHFCVKMAFILNNHKHTSLFRKDAMCTWQLHFSVKMAFVLYNHKHTSLLRQDAMCTWHRPTLESARKKKTFYSWSRPWLTTLPDLKHLKVDSILILVSLPDF
jgi:hypothetical protein